MDEPVFKARGGAQFRKRRVERDDSSEEAEAGEAGAHAELDETAAAIERVRNSQKERLSSMATKKAMMKKKLKEEFALQNDDNEEMVLRLREAEAFDPAKWYPMLKAHCVASHYEDLTLKEAEVLVEAWAQGEPTTEQLINNEPIKEFRQRLQAAIRKFGDLTGDHGKGPLLRLSVGQPFDSPLLTPLMKKPLIEEFKLWLRRRMYTENERLIEMTRLIRRRLRVATGDQALELLLWSKSTIEGLRSQLKAPAWTLKIEMRQWVGEMAPESEFRMFVCNGQLTAACQSHHLLHFPDLRRARRLLEAKLQRLYTQVRAVIKPPHFFVDVVASPNNDAPALVVDMKPFRFTDKDIGLAFDFSSKRDRVMLESGPFELRVREAAVPPPELPTVLSKEMLAMLSEEPAPMPELDGPPGHFGGPPGHFGGPPGGGFGGGGGGFGGGGGYGGGTPHHPGAATPKGGGGGAFGGSFGWSGFGNPPSGAPRKPG